MSDQHRREMERTERYVESWLAAGEAARQVPGFRPVGGPRREFHLRCFDPSCTWTPGPDGPGPRWTTPGRAFRGELVSLALAHVKEFHPQTVTS